jgi:molecular chaperone Hsp33
LRGYANFDKADAGLAEAKGRGDQGALLGKGHVAMTIDRGADKDRYQGIVALDREPLVDAAHTYFRQSEQLPTFIRLAVARHYGRGDGEGARSWHWRAGGLMIQQLPREGGKREDVSSSEEDDEENWNRARHLAATVEDHELLDPLLAPQRLLYRLFHEEGVVVTPAAGLAAACRCSRERIHTYLRQFGPAELEDMREPDGGLTVTCEFCSRKYRFSSADIS